MTGSCLAIQPPPPPPPLLLLPPPMTIAVSSQHALPFALGICDSDPMNSLYNTCSLCLRGCEYVGAESACRATNTFRRTSVKNLLNAWRNILQHSLRNPPLKRFADMNSARLALPPSHVRTWSVNREREQGMGQTGGKGTKKTQRGEYSLSTFLAVLSSRGKTVRHYIACSPQQNTKDLQLCQDSPFGFGRRWPQ